MTKQIKWLLAGAILLLTITTSLTAAFYFAPHRAVKRLHLALRTADTNALAREIDFPAFQASLNQQVTFVVTNKMAQDNPEQKVNPVAAAIAAGIVKYAVKQYATPSGLAGLVTGEAKIRGGSPEKSPAPPNTAELDRAFRDAMREYRSASQYVVYLSGQRGEVTELILERTGLRWQLRHIVLPVEP